MTSLLSITFHCVQSALPQWEEYTATTLSTMVENLMDVEQYVLSEVATSMIAEGKNFNLLLIFESEELRELFTKNELVNLEERISNQYGDQVMVFTTYLNPLKHKL